MPLKTIECALAEVGSEHWRGMPADRLLSIAAVLGPDFTSLWLALAKQGAFSFAREPVLLPGQIVAAIAGDLAQLTEVFADGVITAAEKPVVYAIASRKPARAGTLMQLVAS